MRSAENRIVTALTTHEIKPDSPYSTLDRILRRLFSPRYSYRVFLSLAIFIDQGMTTGYFSVPPPLPPGKPVAAFACFCVSLKLAEFRGWLAI